MPCYIDLVTRDTVDVHDGRSKASLSRANAKLTPKDSAASLPPPMNLAKLTIHTMLNDGVRSKTQDQVGSYHVEKLREEVERALVFAVMPSFRASSGTVCCAEALSAQDLDAAGYNTMNKTTGDRPLESHSPVVAHDRMLDLGNKGIAQTRHRGAVARFLLHGAASHSRSAWSWARSTTMG